MSEPKPVVPRPRIQGLSDLIFGLALSIGSIQLLANRPTIGSDVLAALVVFGFSFLILINVWLRYTSITSVVPIETTGMVRLNILLLFLVAIEPYLFYILTNTALSSPLGQDDSSYYALDIAGMNFVIGYFTHLTTVEGKKLIPESLVRKFRQSRNYILFAGLVFAFSAIPGIGAINVFGTSLRVFSWIATVPIIWLSRIASRTST